MRLAWPGWAGPGWASPRLARRALHRLRVVSNYPPPACCGADNVPGVSGIGPKTAATLLREHGSLAALLEAAAGGGIKPKKAAAALASGE